MNRSIIYWSLACAAALASSRGDAAPLKVELEVSSRSIRAFDPLYTKVTITNETDEAWLEKRPITGASGVIVFQRRYPGRDWHRIWDTNAGNGGSSSQPFAVEAGEEYVSHEAFFTHKFFDEHFAFPHGGGTLQLRAVVHYGEEPIYSNPVTIAVAPIPWGEERLIKKWEQSRDRGVKPDTATLKDALGKCKLKKMLHWSGAMKRFEAAERQEDREKLLRELRKIQKGFDPVTREYTTLRLVHLFYLQKDWESLRAELARLPQRSFKRYSFAIQLKLATGRRLDASD